MRSVLADVPDATLKDLLMNLGGHDIPQILETFATAEATDRPVVIMAYTIKGWGLPIAGHIDNHAAQLTSAHIAALQEQHGIAEGHEWDGYHEPDPIAAGSSSGGLLREMAITLSRHPRARRQFPKR